MIPIRATSGLTAIALAVVFVGMFSFGLSAGSEAATNESVAVENYTQQVEEFPEEIKSNITENMTKAESRPVLAFTMPLLNSQATAAKTGITIGYQYPEAGKTFGAALPLAMIGGVVYVLYRRIQKLRRMARS